MNFTQKMLAPCRVFSRAARSERGTALIEFAIAFPVLFLLIFGGIEVVRLMLFHQKLEKSTYLLGDAVTRYAPAPAVPAKAGELSEEVLKEDIFYYLPYDTLEPHINHHSLHAEVVSSLWNDKGTVRVSWQMAGIGDLSGVNSAVTGLGFKHYKVVKNKPLAGSFPADERASIAGMRNGANVIVVEVFAQYRPILQDTLQGVGGVTGLPFFLEPQVYSKRMYFVPREGALTNLPKK